MAEHVPSSLTMLTEFFTAEHIEAAARRTGFVKRASKMTGKLFLALVTFGVWSDATTTLAQLAAKVTQLDDQLEVSPEAIYQRMNKNALAFLQDLISQALAKVHALAHVCDEGLFPAFTKVYLADSTGFELPNNLHDLFPGSGGSAAKAGAKIQAVWDYKSSVFDHFALTPWNIPDQKYIDSVVALAQKGVLFLFDLGYFKIKAFARIADAGAYFLSRLNHQTTILHTDAGRLQPLDLASYLTPVVGPCLETAIFLGAKERVACRLVASRVPEPIVNARRRNAHKKAKKKGYTPSKAHLTLLAWNLFITNVPHTIWKMEAIFKAYPLRWQIELIFKSWKSYLHLASIKTKKADTTLCYLYGRMLLILLTYALYPQMRATVWLKKKRELSVLKLVRHFQASAEQWMHAIFQSELVLRRFLQRACATAERLVAKASRKRRTTAQILRESLNQQHASLEFAAAVNA
jgi:predicted GIY-YIG superfamily endonuclease